MAVRQVTITIMIAVLIASAEGEAAPDVLERGSAVRLVLDDGSAVEGTIGDISNVSILVRLADGGFRVVDRARVVEPPEARPDDAGIVTELREAPVVAPVAAEPWGGWITVGLGPASRGSGAAGAFTIRYESVHGSFRYENRRERFTRREPPESSYSFGLLGGRTWRLRGDFLRVSAEAGAGVIWGQERGALRFTEERDGETWYVHDRSRYRKPALLGDLSISLHPRIGFCAPESTGVGLALSGAARSGGTDALVLVFLQLGAL